jgi:hypothetical protein
MAGMAWWRRPGSPARRRRSPVRQTNCAHPGALSFSQAHKNEGTKPYITQTQTQAAEHDTRAEADAQARHNNIAARATQSKEGARSKHHRRTCQRHRSWHKIAARFQNSNTLSLLYTPCLLSLSSALLSLPMHMCLPIYSLSSLALPSALCPFLCLSDRRSC